MPQPALQSGVRSNIIQLDIVKGCSPLNSSHGTVPLQTAFNKNPPDKNAAGFQLPYRQGYAVVHHMLGRLSDFDRNALHIDRIVNRERPVPSGVQELLEYQP